MDSNSPAVWAPSEGRPRLYVMTSVNGRPSVASGWNVSGLGAAQPASIAPWPEGGNWMEAVLPDVDGTWYGFYHNERLATDLCPGTTRVTPRIGAAVSRDRGLTWDDLGIILDAPLNSQACSTTNRYFVGGVGDFSVLLDAASTWIYVFYSAYPRQDAFQGVGIARLLWADRDDPEGRVEVWRDGVWLPPRRVRWMSADGYWRMGWRYLFGSPVHPAAQPWHDGDTVVDAFWGPSVHWNTHLEQYVMLLNRASNADFASQGIYVSYAPRLDDPALWSPPTLVLKGGSWYPQVIGTLTGGTDRLAGSTARLFLSGRSQQVVSFMK